MTVSVVYRLVHEQVTLISTLVFRAVSVLVAGLTEVGSGRLGALMKHLFMIAIVLLLLLSTMIIYLETGLLMYVIFNCL